MLLVIFCIINILFGSEIVAGQNTFDKNKIYLEETCVPAPDLSIKNRTHELQCCQIITENFYKSWYIQGSYLSRTFTTLKAWNCPQFYEVCSNRWFAFTDYSSLVYDRFCNESSLLQRCGLVVIEALSTIG